MNLLPVGALQTYEDKIACLTEDEFYDFFEKMDAEPRWVTSDGVRSIQIIGLCHHGGSHSALFDPTSRKVTCFSECGGGMLFHTWVKRAQELDSPQAAKEYISDWIDGQDIDFGDREPNGDTKFEYRERPFERCETPPLEGIELEVIQQMYREDFTHGVENLARTKWSTEDGIDGEVLELFQVAFVQKDNYMVLPHHNRNGQIVGLYARSYRPLRAQIMKEYPEEGWNFWRHFPRAKYVPLNKEKKYLKGEEGEKVCWSFQNSKNLYGLHKAHEAIKESGEAIIFEGGKSVMLAHQWGIKNTVASHTFGAGDYHINMLLNEGAKTIILGFDKQYESQDPYDTQWKQYEHRTYEFAKRIKNHCDVYRLCDRMDGKLDYKDAPVDKGEEYFKWLLAHKEPLFINGEDVYALKKETEKAAKEEQIDIPLQKRGQSRHDKLLAAGIDPHAGEEKWYDLLTGFADLPPESEQYAVGDGKYQYGDLLIQLQDHSDRFLLPNEDNKSVTAYEIIKRLAGPEHFKALKKQIKPRNDKLQVLPYSERHRAIFFFRNQYRKARAPENIDMIVAFIDMAMWKTNNITLNQNWQACLDVTGSEKEAASLLVYYGWAPDLQKELPRLENAFYTVKKKVKRGTMKLLTGILQSALQQSSKNVLSIYPSEKP